MIPLLKKHYRIDSSQRLSGDNGNFSFELRLPPDISGQIDHVSVVGGIVPKSYYLVRDGFNSFTLTEGATEAKITVPAGNYSLSVFKSTIQGLLNTQSPNGWTYAVTFPNSASQVNDGKFTFTVSNNLSQPSFYFFENSDVREQLGFNKTITYNFVANVLKSVNVVKFVSEDSLFLRSDMVDDTGDDTLMNIYTAGSPDFSTISFTNPDVFGTAKRLRTNANSVYRFYLTNESGELIFLNGINMVFTIIVFKRIDVLDKLSAYLTFRYEQLKK